MSNTTTKTNRTAVIVLGMHRSGTSALAGVLNLLGCDEPATLMVPNENNAKGYFESSKLYQLHTQLFASAATHWDDWLPMSPGWFAGPHAAEFHDRAVAAMIAEFGKSPLFLIKDPRICRLVPFWEGVLEEIGAAPRYVLTHRNPLEVAASLHKRDGLSTGQGLLIWLRHVIEAEHDTRGRPRCFTSFAQLMTNWAGVAEKIQSGLDLSLPRFSLGMAGEVGAFLEGSLRHHHERPGRVLQNPMLSPWIRDTYEILDRWASDGEDHTDHARLDAVRAAFDASAPAFAQAMQGNRAEVERLSSEIGKVSTELGAVKGEKTELAAQLEDQRNQLAQEKRAFEKRTRQVEETRDALEKLRANTAERERSHAEGLAQSARETNRLLEIRNALTAELEDLRSQLSGAQKDKEAELEQERNSAAEALERERRSASETIDRERTARVSAEAKIAELDNRVQTQFREMSDLSRLLAQSEQALTTVRVQSQADLAAAQARIGEEEARAAQVRAGLEETEKQLRTEIAALRSSTSWRLTQPLRSVADWVSGNRK